MELHQAQFGSGSLVAAALFSRDDIQPFYVLRDTIPTDTDPIPMPAGEPEFGVRKHSH